jgi:hypothetical protein
MMPMIAPSGLHFPVPGSGCAFNRVEIDRFGMKFEHALC